MQHGSSAEVWLVRRSSWQINKTVVSPKIIHSESSGCCTVLRAMYGAEYEGGLARAAKVFVNNIRVAVWFLLLFAMQWKSVVYYWRGVRRCSTGLGRLCRDCQPNNKQIRGNTVHTNNPLVLPRLRSEQGSWLKLPWKSAKLLFYLTKSMLHEQSDPAFASVCQGLLGDWIPAWLR